MNEKLKQRILEDGKVENSNILSVDGFVNQQVDPMFMQEMAEDLAKHFAGKGVTKVVTIESSGIAPALLTAKELGVPMLILKKQPSKIIYHDLYQTEVSSYTKETSYELTMSKHLLNEEDHVLLIDDFLSNGEAAVGAFRLIRMAHATIAGMGTLIEKVFQDGREKIEENGVDVYSLVQIVKMTPDENGKGKIEFK